MRKKILIALSIILAVFLLYLGFKWHRQQNIITDNTYIEYHFRNDDLLTQHFEKHGLEMGFKSKEAYEKAASDVANDPKALHKKEKEDNDDVYYLEATNEFVVISYDGYIRTYFKPDSGIRYFNRQ